jgi:Flp pilus assembly CpaE family ATPase
MGMIPPRSDLGREMMNNGAKGTVTLPMDDSSVARFLQQAEQIVNAAWRERAEGRVHFGGQAFGGAEDLAYERKSIAVWVPKGGGSTRTTIATNLAVALSHLSLGGKPTVLVDLDMSKGDCHTLLGYTVNPDEAAQYQMPLLEYGLHTLVVRAAQKYGQKGVGVVDATLINRHLTHWRPNESQLRLLPGLTSPSQAAAEEFKNWPMLYDITRTLLGELRRMGTFVICDLGQDFTVPLHRAALEEVDEVLVTVPPTRTAITDTVYALPTLKHQMGGDLSKFKLVITAYDPAFGISDREMQRAIGLPLLTVIPHDALVAHQAVNEGLPFVLSDREGPLGSAIVELAGIYLPGMKQQRSGLRIGNLKRLFVREA